MTSLIAAIRAAVRPGAAPHVFVTGEGEPDASASISEAPLLEAPITGAEMPDPQPGAGIAPASIAQAVATAAAGGADGFKAATDRMNAILGADGVKGDAKRMSAALDLSTASPDMTAEAVVSFVVANVPSAEALADAEPAAAAASASTASTYEAQRLAAANLAMPGASGVGQKAAAVINRDAIFAARRVTPKGA